MRSRVRFITADDRAILDASPFISAVKLTGQLPSCESICGSAPPLLATPSLAAAPYLAFGASAPTRAFPYGSLVAASKRRS